MQAPSPSAAVSIFEIFKSAEQKKIEQAERAWKMSGLEAFRQRIYAASNGSLAYEWLKYNKKIKELESSQHDVAKAKAIGGKAMLQHLLRTLPHEQRIVEQEAVRRKLYFNERMFQGRPFKDDLHAWDLSTRDHAEILAAWEI